MIKDLLTFLWQGLIVIAGWWIVHYLAVRRDRDKGRRDIVSSSSDDLSTLVAEILLEARDYHTQDRDDSKSIKLKMQLQDLGQRITGLHEICNRKDLLAACSSAVLNLRKKITYKHFDDEHEGRLTERDVLLEEMAEAALHLKRHLLRLKHSQFC